MTQCDCCQEKRVMRVLNGIRSHMEPQTQMVVETFLISDKPNKQGWYTSWDSIVKNAKSFIGRPGVLYEECDMHECKLKHPSTINQEKYAVSRITSVNLDESAHTAYATHEITDPAFAVKLRQNDNVYVSPSILPINQPTPIYRMDGSGLVWNTGDWLGLHLAWVDSPAYGSVAGIRRILSATTKERIDRVISGIKRL